MKLIIDIPELAYDRLLGEQHIPNMDYEYLIIHGTPIPDNATNGDIMEIMFSKVNFYVGDWWDKPYQRGSK